MYNRNLVKINPFSAFKIGAFLGGVISAAALIVDFFAVIVRSITTAIGPGLFINAFLSGLIRLFFAVIFFAFGSIILGGILALLCYIFNYSVKWTDGIKVEVNEYYEKEENKSNNDNPNDNDIPNENIVQ